MSVVGVDLGGTKILARVVDPATGRTVGRKKVPTPKDGTDAVMSAVAELVRDVTASVADGTAKGVSAEDAAEAVTAVGVGVPGLVEADGTVSRCPNIPGWDQPVAVKTILEADLGLPVVVSNDVNCGAVAEHRLGAGRGTDDLLAVFVGTGVGGGLIINNQLVVGERGMAGEIGHLTVVSDGRICGCGERGHLESYAGRAGIEREARRLHAAGRPNALVELAGESPIKSRHLEQALAAGDEVAHQLVDDAVMALAIGIGNVATLLDLSRVVVGGGVADKLGRPFLEQIMGSPDFGGFGPQVCTLELAQHLDDAGVLGAALLAADLIEN